jgi:hypothetical protein
VDPPVQLASLRRRFTNSHILVAIPDSRNMLAQIPTKSNSLSYRPGGVAHRTEAVPRRSHRRMTRYDLTTLCQVRCGPWKCPTSLPPHAAARGCAQSILQGSEPQISQAWPRSDPTRAPLSHKIKPNPEPLRRTDLQTMHAVSPILGRSGATLYSRPHA